MAEGNIDAHEIRDVVPETRRSDSAGVRERGMHAWGFPRNLRGPVVSDR